MPKRTSRSPREWAALLHAVWRLWCRFLGRHAGRLSKSGALPGVGEALKREIVGLGLVCRLLLWGFGRWVCLGSGLTDPLTVVC